MRFTLRNVLLSLTLLATSAEGLAQSAPAADKHVRLRKLQKINRVFQVCYGRSLKREEMPKVLSLSETQLVQKLTTSDELQKVYARRLADFTGNVQNAEEISVPSRVNSLARPLDKLDVVLGAVDRDHHKGEQCGDQSNSVCFATWLVTSVAPTLGYKWVTERTAQLPTWTYAKLLEEISRSSISQ